MISLIINECCVVFSQPCSDNIVLNTLTGPSKKISLKFQLFSNSNTNDQIYIHI